MRIIGKKRLPIVHALRSLGSRNMFLSFAGLGPWPSCPRRGEGHIMTSSWLGWAWQPPSPLGFKMAQGGVLGCVCKATSCAGHGDDSLNQRTGSTGSRCWGEAIRGAKER